DAQHGPVGSPGAGGPPCDRAAGERPRTGRALATTPFGLLVKRDESQNRLPQRAGRCVDETYVAPLTARAGRPLGTGDRQERDNRLGHRVQGKYRERDQECRGRGEASAGRAPRQPLSLGAVRLRPGRRNANRGKRNRRRRRAQTTWRTQGGPAETSW